MAPAHLSSKSASEQEALMSSNDSLSISGLELDRTASGLQHISSEADQWKVLQDHSKLETCPLERSSENNPHLRYGHEHLEANREDDDKEASKGHVDHKYPSTYSRRCRVSAGLLGAVIVVVVVLSTVLTRFLKKGSIPSKNLPVNPLDTGISSASGAYNGTGIATLEPGDFDDSYHLFYQHYDGQIKHLTSTDPRTADWTESPDSDYLPSNARNRTPLFSVVTFDGIHLFYIDTLHRVQEKQRSNNSQDWLDGPLSSKMVPASNSLVVAFYATSVSFPANTRYLIYPYYSIYLYYGSNDGSVHELSSGRNGSIWNNTFTFAGSSSNSGIAIGPYFGDHAKDSLVTVDASSSQIQMWTNVPDLGGWVQVAKTANITPHAYTCLGLYSHSINFHYGNHLNFQSANGSMLSIRPTGTGLSSWSTNLLGLPALAVPATQMGNIDFKSILYIQISGEHISGYGLDEHGSYVPVPNPI